MEDTFNLLSSKSKSLLARLKSNPYSTGITCAFVVLLIINVTLVALLAIPDERVKFVVNEEAPVEILEPILEDEESNRS